jgi:cold shock CspA family protein
MSSPEESQIVTRILGRVKWFNSKVGYGFITVCKSSADEPDKDIFVHFSSIRVNVSQYKYLVQGEYVEFELVKSTNTTHEFNAVDVTGVNGGLLMCQSQTQPPSSRVFQSRNPIRSHYQMNDNRNRPLSPNMPPHIPPQTPRSYSSVATVNSDGFTQVRKHKAPKQ